MALAVSIRSAHPEEFQAVGQLTALAYADVLADGPSDPYLAVLRDAAHRAAEAELWVATDDDNHLLGTVTVGRPGTSYAELAGTDELEVRMLAVDPDRSRQGIGRLLMDHVHAIARHEGFGQVVLSVISTNSAAAKFYLSLGYQRCPARDWRPRTDMDVLLHVFTRTIR